MIFTGPLADALAVLVGGLAGTAIGDRISDRLNNIMMQALGLAAAPSDEEELEDAKNS